MTVTDIISKKELDDRLSDFKTDSTQVYVHRISDSWKMLLSEGCFFVREAADAYWLFDLILSYQSSSALIGILQQRWTVKRLTKGQLQIVCVDRKGRFNVTTIEKRNFVLDNLTIYVTGNYARLKSEFLYG